MAFLLRIDSRHSALGARRSALGLKPKGGSRELLLVLLAVAACGRQDRSVATSSQSASKTPVITGPQSVVLRISREGSPPRVTSYPRVDSTLWRSTDPAPTPSEVFAFDDESGSVAYEDVKGRPVLLEMRLGTIVVASSRKLTGLASADGVSLYGIAPNGEVVRTTPTGEWTYKPPQPASAVFPQPEGTLLVAVGTGANRRLLKLFPPDKRILDSLPFPVASRTVPTQLGDRVYLAVDSGLVVLRTRTMDWAPSIRFDEPIAVLTATPSGDRVFVLTNSRREISVVDRYREEVTATMELPGPAQDLRVDPFGRYLLVRAAERDSIWIFAIGTDRLIGGLKSAWRTDLPFVGYDGAVAVASGRDVLLFDGETLKQRSRIREGAQDFWYPFLWDGFRPRSASLDVPVRFDSVLGVAVGDSLSARVGDSAVAGDTTTPKGFILSFAAFLTEDRARELAARIHVGGENARVAATPRGGATIYRVVLGPYLTKEEAERVGRESGHSYWVFEGSP